MRRLALFLVVGAALLLPARAIDASPITFVATLTGASESPPTGSPGTGHATVVLDPVANTLHVDVTFSGLLAGTTMSHIHCCLPSPEAPGINVGVATTTPTFPGFPLGVTSGTYSHDFRADPGMDRSSAPTRGWNWVHIGNPGLMESDPIFLAMREEGAYVPSQNGLRGQLSR